MKCCYLIKSIRPYYDKYDNYGKHIAKTLKPIRQINYYTNKVIKEFQCIKDAERETGIPATNIIGVLKGRNHRTKEFRWEYIENEE